MTTGLMLFIILFCCNFAQIRAQEVSSKDCDKYCGRGKTCTQANDGSEVKCNSCGKGRKLRNGKCLYLGRWSSWSPCSATCGLGINIRKRECRWDRAHLCFPFAPQQRECSDGPCNSEVTGWSPWGPCSTSCGADSVQTRHRGCITDATLPIPCKQDLTDSRACSGNPPCDCHWCEWEEKQTGFSKDCLQVTTLLEREPNCPAYQPPAKNCTGLSNGIIFSPQAPGRQTEIRTSRTLKYSFPHNITKNTKFDFSCVGGCIKIEKVDFKCNDETRFLGTERVAELCGGKDRCVFKPDGKFFEVDHLGCTSVYAQVDVQCVGGKAVANHSVHDLSCLEECKGVCTKINGNVVCKCQNGGIAPECKISEPICKYTDCGFGICKQQRDNTPVCTCFGGERCGRHAKCDVNGKCICMEEEGTPPNCAATCKKDCPQGSSCTYNLKENREECICTFGGRPPNCKKCGKKCEDGTQCFINDQGSSQCLCPGTLLPECPVPCSKVCEKGKCVTENGQDICICHDGSRDYPECQGPCSKEECSKGKCINGNGIAKCLCLDGRDNYPNCDIICDQLDCPANDGHCVKFDNGVIECACNNGHRNYPICAVEEPCICPDNAVCVYTGGKSYCKCKNNNVYPECEDTRICSESRQKECQKNNGQCVVLDFQAICICNNKQDIYPGCTKILGM